jgi:hypothetical protein
VFQTQEYKNIFIPPFTCRKIFQELEVDVLFPPFHEGNRKENFILLFQTSCDLRKNIEIGSL